LFLLTVFTLLAAARFSTITVENVSVDSFFEGDCAKLSARVSVKGFPAIAVTLGSFRMDPSLKSEESSARKISFRDGPKVLECFIRTKHRGAYPLNKVAASVHELVGMLRFPIAYKGSVELLVYPRPVKVSEFPFLVSGVSGTFFSPFLMPSHTRGMNFVGLREYREGDSLRDLHHKAFARYGRPFTKEFESERGAGVILLLDTATPTVSSRAHLEDAIRLATGVGQWLADRNILGRFFIDDEEISLQGSGGRDVLLKLLEALARIPAAKIVGGKKPSSWSPAARPMDPVLRIGLYAKSESLIHKHILVGSSENVKSAEDALQSSDDTLWIDLGRLRKNPGRRKSDFREVEVRL
ncbi:MAG: DUF58 domain-containing protein, partial [Fibrobacter sp.]|nr:DUF58 domain-containing protein [Fibrobacter sp.]